MWGFLDWYGTSDGGQNGYRLLDGYLPVGFALLAGLFAVVNLRADRTERTAWLAIGTSLFAVAFTIVAVTVKPTLILLLEGFSGLGGTDAVRLSIRIGLILTLVTTILQLFCLVLAWLFASGRVVMSGRSGLPAAPISGGPPSFEPQPSPPSFAPPPSPPSYGGAPSAPPSFGGAPSWSQSFAPPGPAGHAEWRPDDSPQRPGAT